jgi:hypothetical protein
MVRLLALRLLQMLEDAHLDWHPCESAPDNPGNCAYGSRTRRL